MGTKVLKVGKTLPEWALRNLRWPIVQMGFRTPKIAKISFKYA